MYSFKATVKQAVSGRQLEENLMVGVQSIGEDVSRRSLWTSG
jgi:hypothetical protein